MTKYDFPTGKNIVSVFESVTWQNRYIRLIVQKVTKNKILQTPTLFPPQN